MTELATPTEIETPSSAVVCGCGDDGSCGSSYHDRDLLTSITFAEIWSYLASNKRFNYLVISTLLAVLGIFSIVLFGHQDWIDLIWWLSGMIGLIVPLQLSWKSLKKKTLNINTLLSVATISSLLLGLFEEAVILVIIFSIGEIMESVLVQLMNRELDVLKELLPPKAVLIHSDGSRKEIDVSEIEKRQQFLVNSGDLVPVDAINKQSTVEVQTSHLTGESEPEVVEQGEEIFAGSLLVTGSTIIQSSVNAGESYVHDIVKSVEDSLSRNSSAERFSQKFGRYYTPAVFIFALIISFAVPLVLDQAFLPWMMRALVILVVSCACGLAVSVPVTVVSSVTSAAKRQILIRGGAALEKISDIQTIIFDKTGTLTFGEPEIQDFVLLKTPENIHAILKSMSKRSNHPVSRSLLHYLADTAEVDLDDIKEVAGVGLSAIRGSNTIDLVRDEGAAYRQQVTDSYSAQSSYSVIKYNGDNIGYIVFEDRIRHGARNVIAELESQGIKTIMITGDNQETAEYVAQQLNISDFRAGVLPEEKKEAVQELQQLYGYVAMVGDGINDAPALAEANVGFAMGQSGTEIAAEIADVVLIDDDLSKVVQTIRHGKAGFGIVKQNTVLALLTVASLLVLAGLGFLDLVSGIIANEATAVAIIANGLRMLKFTG